MYKMINITNSALCYIRKLILCVLITRKKLFIFNLCLYEMMYAH